jgi:type IV pilus assembly protein PilP
MIAKIMFKHTLKIRNITCLLCFLLLVYGCGDKKSEPKQTKKVVSKKIAVQKTETETKKVPAAIAEASGQTTPESGDGMGMEGEQIIPDAPELSQDNLLARAAIGYDPKGKVDPFVPLIKAEKKTKKGKGSGTVVAANKVERKKRKPTTPLERIELSQLSLRAIVRSAQGNKALVEESSGKGYIITKGTFIGVNQGTVIDIQKDRVIVEEEVEDIQGDVIFKTRELRLPKPSGEE